MLSDFFRRSSSVLIFAQKALFPIVSKSVGCATQNRKSGSMEDLSCHKERMSRCSNKHTAHELIDKNIKRGEEIVAFSVCNPQPIFEMRLRTSLPFAPLEKEQNRNASNIFHCVADQIFLCFLIDRTYCAALLRTQQQQAY